MLRISARRARAMVLITFGVSCAMFLAEAAAAVYDARRSANGSLTLDYWPRSLTRPDHELGYALNPGARVLATRKWSDTTLFRVAYTITDAGVRITRGNPLGDTWLFIGCSFTFGEGVEDDETLPARFSEQLGWKANVVNLSATGYGAHHMLRLLETGRLGGVGPPVKHVIYQAIPQHVERAVGRAMWDLDGPSYRISGDSIRFAGPFHGSAGIRAVHILRMSDLGRLLDRALPRHAPKRCRDRPLCSDRGESRRAHEEETGRAVQHPVLGRRRQQNDETDLRSARVDGASRDSHDLVPDAARAGLASISPR